MSTRVVMNRRNFISSAGALLLDPLVAPLVSAQTKATVTAGATPPADTSAADYKLKIQPCTLEISPGVTVKTVGYNGQVPGPMLRLQEGKPVKIDVLNGSDNPDIVHWHGL